MENKIKDFMLGLSGILQIATATTLISFVNAYVQHKETIRRYEEATPVVRELNNDELADIVLVEKSGKTLLREYINLGDNKYELLKDQHEEK